MTKHLFTVGTLAAFLAAAPALAANMTLSSPDVAPGRAIPDKHILAGFGCQGGNISPALEWKGAPADTRSYAVTVYDPDAPTGSGWWHWVVFNLPAQAKGLPSGAGNATSKALPAGAVQGRTDFGSPGYGGPCPPEGHGIHRYVFTVHALKVESLPLDANASAAMVGFMVNANTLAKASFTATYQR